MLKPYTELIRGVRILSRDRTNSVELSALCSQFFTPLNLDNIFGYCSLIINLAALSLRQGRGAEGLFG